MATYAIGDLQGCLAEFEALLSLVDFSANDRLWLVGDLINRGEDSLGTLLKVYEMSDRVEIVLGNHDLHYLAIVYGGHSAGRSDTFDALLAHPQRDTLAEFLCQQKLLVSSSRLGYVMTHAGIPHIWNIEEARAYAAEVEAVLRDDHPDVSREQFFSTMYGNKPKCWHSKLGGMERLRIITNYFTRMRALTMDGTLNFSHKGVVEEIPEGFEPWFQWHPEPTSMGGLTILFGHWAALDGWTGRKDILALDTGCVWGRRLTALCLESGKYFTVSAQ